jgi:hypothetical protein
MAGEELVMAAEVTGAVTRIYRVVDAASITAATLGLMN